MGNISTKGKILIALLGLLLFVIRKKTKANIAW